MTDSHIYCFLMFRAGGCPFYSLSRSHPSEIYVLQIIDLPLPCFSCPSFSWSEILGRLSFQKIWNFRPDSLDADTPFSCSENLGVKNTLSAGPTVGIPCHPLHFPTIFSRKNGHHWIEKTGFNYVESQFIASIFRHIPNQSIFFVNLELMSSKWYCIPCIPIIVHKFLCNRLSLQIAFPSAVKVAPILEHPVELTLRKRPIYNQSLKSDEFSHVFTVWVLKCPLLMIVRSEVTLNNIIYWEVSQSMKWQSRSELTNHSLWVLQ